jgi:hypothetical protein
MDLDATLIRAEQLFRRYRRLVDAIDNKHTFPPPKPLSPGQKSDQGGSSQGAAASTREDAGKQPEKERVITPELRRLLSRKVDVVTKRTSVAKGASGSVVAADEAGGSAAGKDQE